MSFLPNNPLPLSLSKECTRAAKIIASFAGMDGLIPSSVLANARGFAILTVSKISFLGSLKAGSGLVIARISAVDESGRAEWSSPSAIGTMGAGIGLSVGAEVEEIIIVLNSRKALKSFTTGGSVTLGGSLSITAGPVGRNLESSGILSQKGTTSMFSYSRSKGAFLGVSLEGSVIAERADANSEAYGFNVSAHQLLNNPALDFDFHLELVSTLERACGIHSGNWIEEDEEDEVRRVGTPEYSFGSKNASGNSTPVKKEGRSRAGSLVEKFRAVSVSMSPSNSKNGSRSRSGSILTLGKSSKKAVPPTSSENYNNEFDAGSPSPSRMMRSSSSRTSEMYQFREDGDDGDRYGHQENSPFDDPRPPNHRSRSSSVLKKTSASLWNVTEPLKTHHDDRLESETEDFSIIPASFALAGRSHSQSLAIAASAPPRRPEFSSQNSIGTAIALYDLFSSVEGDLSFKKGELIEIIGMIDDTEWMQGRKASQTGIFPANYVEIHLD